MWGNWRYAVNLKGTPTEGTSWPEDRTYATAYIFFWMFHLVVLSVLTQKKYMYRYTESTFLLWKLFSAQPCSVVGLPFTNEKQKRLSGDIWYFCHTFQPHLWRHLYRLLGRKWQISQSCFCNFQIWIFKTGWEVKKCCVCVFNSIPVDRACAAALVWFPFSLTFSFWKLWKWEHWNFASLHFHSSMDIGMFLWDQL